MWLKSVRIYKKTAIFSQFFKFFKNTFAYNFKTVIATNEYLHYITIDIIHIMSNVGLNQFQNIKNSYILAVF